MITTELASAVLETKVKSVKQDGNEIEFFGENLQSLGKYNIYEFVHKAKLKMEDHGYAIEVIRHVSRIWLARAISLKTYNTEWHWSDNTYRYLKDEEKYKKYRGEVGVVIKLCEKIVKGTWE